MGFERAKRIPQNVERAKELNDKPALRAMGKKGGHVTAERNAIWKNEAETRRLKEEADLRKSTNEDTLTADGEVVQDEDV